MRAYCTRCLSMILGWASGSAVTLPLQPNHNPPWVWNASRTATARPPAAPLPVGSGAATRLETTTSRGKCLLQYHRWKRSGRETGQANNSATRLSVSITCCRLFRTRSPASPPAIRHTGSPHDFGRPPEPDSGRDRQHQALGNAAAAPTLTKPSVPPTETNRDRSAGWVPPNDDDIT